MITVETPCLQFWSVTKTVSMARDDYSRDSMLTVLVSDQNCKHAVIEILDIEY